MKINSAIKLTHLFTKINTNLQLAGYDEISNQTLRNRLDENKTKYLLHPHIEKAVRQAILQLAQELINENASSE